MIPSGATAADDRAMLALLANAEAELNPPLVERGVAAGTGGSAVMQAARSRMADELEQVRDGMIPSTAVDTSGLRAYEPGEGPGTDEMGGSLESLQRIALANIPPFSVEREGTDLAEGFGSGDTEAVEDAPPELEEAHAFSSAGLLGQGVDRADPDVQAALAALYGPTFPLIMSESPGDEEWIAWAESLFSQHQRSKTTILWMVERLRKMRVGEQWISSVGQGPWRVPPQRTDLARIVDNVIAPALDYRLEVQCEQRPGWKARPINQDPRNAKKAEAQQMAVDYQYDQQQFRRIMREIGYYAGTDGCCFTESYWDPDRGPWDEVLIEGNAAPGLDRTGAVDPLSPVSSQMPKGDVGTIVHRIEDVVVSANATATIEPDYWVIRKQRTESEAVKRWGPAVVQRTTSLVVEPSGGSPITPRHMTLSMAPDVDELKRDQVLVDEYTVYCTRSWVLPRGLALRIVGQAVVVPPQPLPYGEVPMVRWTDGSSDPSFFPRPIAYEWIPSQMRINALWSKLYDNVRLDSGTKLLAKREALSSETLTSGTMTVYEVRSGGSINDAVRELGPSRISADVLTALQHEMQRFEQLSGWNDTARGSVTPDQSGRAILANREMLERVFAPAVNDLASSMASWAEIQCAIMRWGYDEPRTVALTGASRPDLTRAISADDFDGVAQITVDPETLMPYPRALRLFILEDMFSKGLISAQEYRRRLPFGFVNNLDTPDTDHYARAQRAVEAIRRTGVATPAESPILWMDDPAIHQDVLARELILPDDIDPRVRSAAYDRWMLYAELAAMQGAQASQGGPVPHGPPPVPMPGPAGSPAGGADGSAGAHGSRGSADLLPSGVQPFQGTAPGIAASTASAMAGGTAEQMAGRMADVTSHQP